MSSETRSSPVKEARTALGLRLIDVADQAGMSVSLISMIEHGYVPAKPRREQLSEVLGQAPEVLWPEVSR
jgi:transcriptional regulator with XRE-family HTH domain